MDGEGPAQRKRCVVVGGTGRLGRAVVSELASAGARVGFLYRENRVVADDLLARLPGSCARQADVADTPALTRALDELTCELGSVDALVYAAAVGSTRIPPGFDELEEVTVEGWNRLFAVNVAGAFFAARSVAAHLAKTGGNIVLVGSIDGVKSVPAPVPYATSKGALQGMTLSLAKNLGSKNIRVNLVAPGVLEEGLSHTLPDHLRREYLKHSGFKRLGRMAEIAAVVTWLALENSYVTGQTIVIDGGL